MTYYEELGVNGTASTDDIREAYKRLARLLHPDKMQDEKLRKLAECQMKRLNSIYETLTHPANRDAYDRSLRPAIVLLPELDTDSSDPRPTVDWRRLWDWRWWVAKLRGPDGAWIGAAFIVVFLILYSLADSSIQPAGSVVQPKSDVPESASRSESGRKPAAADPVQQLQLYAMQLQKLLEAARHERDEARQRVAALEVRLRETHSEEVPLSPPPPTIKALPAMPQLSRLPSPPMYPPSQAKQPKNELAGNWFYSRPRSAEPAADLYPPEFIETMIAEDGGVLHGRYRARYRVTDRAISPEVSFQFTGKAGPDLVRLAFAGAGGAKGVVRLKLLSQNRLEVVWTADELGASLGLGFGTAVLIRRQDPSNVMLR